MGKYTHWLGCIVIGVAPLALARPAAFADEVIVDEIIPVPEGQAEVITVEPSDEHLWIPGYWERDPGSWTWVKGHSDKPPHKDTRWLNGHWKWHEGKWHSDRGHWARGLAGKGWIVDEIIDAPPVLKQAKPPAPSDKNHWVTGYWEWDGHWRWMPGYWTTKPHPKAEWVAGHWDKHGGHGHRWIAGHWNVQS